MQKSQTLKAKFGLNNLTRLGQGYMLWLPWNCLKFFGDFSAVISLPCLSKKLMVRIYIYVRDLQKKLIQNQHLFAICLLPPKILKLFSLCFPFPICFNFFPIPFVTYYLISSLSFPSFFFLLFSQLAISSFLWLPLSFIFSSPYVACIFKL